MKHSVKLFTLALMLMTISTAAFAKGEDKLDIWLNKYEAFVQRVEDAANKEQISKAEAFSKERDKLFVEKDKIQAKQGNFTFKQGLRYAALNSRYGVCIGALNAAKGIKNASRKIDESIGDE